MFIRKTKQGRRVFENVNQLLVMDKLTCALNCYFKTLRLRAHLYVRFQKDPFWSVHTYRTSIRRPRSHGRGLILGMCLHLKSTACVFYMYVDRDRLASSSNRTSFSLFPLLASVVLLYCFTCLCPEEGVYVVCESWRQVIKERLQRQNETQTGKRRSKMKQKQNTRPSSKKTTR